MSKSKRTPRSKTLGLPPLVWVGLAVVAIAALGFMLWRSLPAAPMDQARAEPAEIDAGAAHTKYLTGVLMLDVREQSEWDEVHIPGAKLIPLGQLAERLNEVPRDQEVVVYCRSGNRSQQGRDILRAAGFTQVTHMAGGIKAWVAAGFETQP